MEEFVYLNGNMLPLSQAKISATDYGFLYGYGLFETMRAYNGVVFRLDSHLDRLSNSADKLGIAVDKVVLKKAIMNVLELNGLKDARIRLTTSIGEGSPIPDLQSCTKPTILVIATEYISYSNEIYEKGFRVIVSSIRRNSQSPVSSMKTTNYMESLLARQEARAAAVDDAIFVNDIGQITEASTSNIFLVGKDVVKTPGPDCGILPGITRGIVLELAAELNIETLETDIYLQELADADEVFLTNSVMEIMPVTELNNKAISNGEPGMVTRRLMRSYKELVIRETS